jgi:carboxyl-terminal processing protease
MEKFIAFMKTRKGLLLAGITLFGAVFFAFKVSSTNGELQPSQRQKLLATVGVLLESQHYSPKAIDDAFSKKLFTAYLKALDPEKTLFLQSDIAGFKKFETSLDDEINGAPIAFVPAVSEVYTKRLNEIILLYKEALKTPLDFSAKDSVLLENEKQEFASTTAIRKERWRKQLAYAVLERYADYLEQREKNKGKKDYVAKADSTLERMSREQVLKATNKRFERIQKTFNEDQRFSTYINAITGLMDPHTDYFPPIEKRAFDEGMSGRFFGIGAQLGEDENGIKIATVQPGGAAWKSREIDANDVILKVAQGSAEPVDVAGYATEDAVKIIRGNKGTEVRLTIKKTNGTVKVVSLIREEIVLDETFARSAIVTEGTDKIGYIYLPEFYADYEREDGNRCSEDIAKEIVKFKAENVKGIVIDLRNNGGGSLYEVIQMVGLFINQGPVVQVRDREGKSTVLSDRQAGTLYDGPLAVMVNEFSASASEIFAAAIQDYKRGVIIGSTSTYGKGTVQRSVPFGNPIDQFSGRTDMGAVKLTFQMFYRVNGASTQLRGVESDIVLPDSYEYLKLREKDNESSLPFHKIATAPYFVWTQSSVYESAIASEKQRIQKDTNFTTLKNNLSWIASTSEGYAPLNLADYQAQQVKIKKVVEQNNTLLKPAKNLTINPVAVDNDKFYNNPDKNKGERYKAWLNALKSDMPICETVKVMNKMIAAKSSFVYK